VNARDEACHDPKSRLAGITVSAPQRGMGIRLARMEDGRSLLGKTRLSVIGTVDVGQPMGMMRCSGVKSCWDTAQHEEEYEEQGRGAPCAQHRRFPTTHSVLWLSRTVPYFQYAGHVFPYRYKLTNLL